MSEVEIVTWPFQEESLNQLNNRESYLNYPVIYLLNNA